MIVVYGILIFLAGIVVGIGATIHFMLEIGRLKISTETVDGWFGRHYAKCERTRAHYGKWVG